MCHFISTNYSWSVQDHITGLIEAEDINTDLSFVEHTLWERKYGTELQILPKEQYIFFTSCRHISTETDIINQVINTLTITAHWEVTQTTQTKYMVFSLTYIKFTRPVSSIHHNTLCFDALAVSIYCVCVCIYIYIYIHIHL